MFKPSDPPSGTSESSEPESTPTLMVSRNTVPIMIVVDNPRDWPLHIPEVLVISARAYLTDPQYTELRNVKVFNLCRSYRYQSMGYYVSLLATARGHKPIPNIRTIQDMKLQTIVRFASEELEEMIQKHLATLQRNDKFTLDIYFGQTHEERYERLSLELFKLFQTPFLRAQFVFNAFTSKWQLQSLGPIAANDISVEHRPFVVRAATEYFAGRRAATSSRKTPMRYDMAILCDPQEKHPPSDEKAIKRFIKAAESLGIAVELINKDDLARIAEFDALFIRETTSVNHYTYRFARKAATEGLVVIDDPESILKCTNKVYLAELLNRHKILTPATMIVHRRNLGQVGQQMSWPCILKQPDGSFSQGVVKVDDEKEFLQEAKRLLEKSELVIAQEFLPTPFDWRIGILDRKPLYACKYFMAKKHWQIIQANGQDKPIEGRSETLPVELVPKRVVSTALKAANLIGDGLYGVDLKQVGQKCYVIEINDNPSIDSGVEDMMLRDQLYTRIMEVFLKRIERHKEYQEN